MSPADKSFLDHESLAPIASRPAQARTQPFVLTLAGPAVVRPAEAEGTVRSRHKHGPPRQLDSLPKGLLLMQMLEACEEDWRAGYVAVAGWQVNGPWSTRAIRLT